MLLTGVGAALLVCATEWCLSLSQPVGTLVSIGGGGSREGAGKARLLANVIDMHKAHRLWSYRQHLQHLQLLHPTPPATPATPAA